MFIYSQAQGHKMTQKEISKQLCAVMENAWLKTPFNMDKRSCDIYMKTVT